MKHCWMYILCFCFWTGLFRKQAQGVLLATRDYSLFLGWKLALKWKISSPQQRKICPAGLLKDWLLRSPKVLAIGAAGRTESKSKIKSKTKAYAERNGHCSQEFKTLWGFEATWRTPLLNLFTGRSWDPEGTAEAKDTEYHWRLADSSLMPTHSPSSPCVCCL